MSIYRTNFDAAFPAPLGAGDSRRGVLSGDSPAYRIVKRALDITVSATALTVLAPVYAAIAVAVALDSRGSIFYRQERVGKDGRRFAFYKFRSMVVDADRIKADLSVDNEAQGPIFKMKSDPRVTRVGRFLRRTSLDEIPQFWNVLRGDLSLVGPRPHLPSEVEKYSEVAEMRLTVVPGLVCYREVGGRSKLTFDQWVALDLEYVRTRSLRTDLSILLRAVPAILFGEGAY
ncbi:MAG: sugar transferase [Armatimonadota bacterium]